MKQIVMRPIITEKSLAVANRGWYTFSVAASRNKSEIAKAICTLYNVTVTGVRSFIIAGKGRRVGKKMKQTQREDWKKALVHVAAGQKIDAFEVTGEREKKP
ncbi:50S ribosomal protein L23 [Candidatus Gottesmanbacteria bacterium RIFCSPLOWO2_01_FULL_49_10]|uniref:Large ribosomal subunit protein uL23 n=1 Tax=Candidatus Gottesmanbacteria bacterium RIFCSPLOWO2_01_FULL_49_10 TaxID=1798396 RepID=A0A1F6AXG5_9BACT|nr:MAG: 50S ribosomal protein L23 [Candidatus Gottesmanbacteria bacterium RIFCSPLOWO2_01_FULL_49_10]